MLTDTHIIARQSVSAGATAVLATGVPVLLRDGLTITLHAVQCHGLPALTQRALVMPGGRLLLIDLERLARGIDAELRATPERDVAGHVYYTLRLRYLSAAQFMAAAERTALGSWWPVSHGYVWHAAARAVDPDLLATTALATLHATPTFAWVPAC